MDKVFSTLKQFARDWSSEGASERLTSYGPVLQEIEGRYAHLEEHDKYVSVATDICPR